MQDMRDRKAVRHLENKTDLKPESSGNTQALNIAEDQHFLRKKRIA